MLIFRVFATIQSHRSLDSFLGLNPIPCPRFLNSLACHRSENKPGKSSACHTSKTPENNPCVCHTSEIPRGPSHFDSARSPALVGVSIPVRALCGSRIPVHFPTSPFLSYSSELFCIYLHFFALMQNSTLLFSCNSELFHKNTGGGRGSPCVPALATHHSPLATISISAILEDQK